jgi:hypothetical protein
LALLRASTLRPLAVDILSLKPCLLRLFLFDGWYVLFICLFFYLFSYKSDRKSKNIFLYCKENLKDIIFASLWLLQPFATKQCKE